MAKNYKDILVQQIEEEESAWLFARIIEKTATLNFSESMWEKVLSDQMYPKGHAAFSRIGRAFADLSDTFAGTYLLVKCGWGVRADPDNMRTCLTSIKDWGNQYAFTVNAQNVKGTEDAFKVMLGYVSKFAMYLNDGPSFFWNQGYTPSSNQLHIIINADYKFQEVSTLWSKDRTTYTYNAPADIETDKWKEKIEIGFRKGWTKV